MVLGMHEIESVKKKALAVRTFLLDADEAGVVASSDNRTYKMEKIKCRIG